MSDKIHDFIFMKLTRLFPRSCGNFTFYFYEVYKIHEIHEIHEVCPMNKRMRRLIKVV